LIQILENDEGFHSASTGKNKKVIEISPLLAFWHERAKE